MSEITAEAEVDNNVKEQAIHRKFREEGEASLFDYLKSLASDTPIKVSVIRELPKTWEGRTIEGTLDSFEDPISEEEIREMFGGGKYKLVIYTPSPKGSWQYATARKIKIAGDPKLEGLITAGGNSKQQPTQDTDVVRDAMRMSQQMASRAQERADRADELRFSDSKKPDPASEMMMEELRAVRRELSSKDERLFEMATSKPESSVLETLFGKSLEGESVRMQGIRAQTESELRVKNEAHAAEVKQINERMDRMIDRSDDAHKREITSLERAHDNALTVLHASYKGQISGYEREISYIARQLETESKAASDLRAKKDKSPLDTLTELAAMKDAMESFTGKDEKEEGGALERVVGNIMGSPLLEGIATRVAGGGMGMGAPQPQQEEEPELPINQPVEMPDGRILIRKADGTIMQIRKKEKPAAPTGEGVDISDEDISIAMHFMESSLSNDADPVEFGRAARNLAPSLTSGPIQQLLRAQGVDAFLGRVSKLNPYSALLSQHGKNWVRKVVAVLLES